MAIISFDKDTVIDYEPEFNDNRDSKDPCVIGIKFVNYGKVQEYAKSIRTRIAAKSKGMKINKLPSIQAEVEQSVQKKQFVDNIDYVKNFSVVGKDGKAKKCEDIGEFYEKAPTHLILEIIGAMEDSAKLTEGQVKN